MSIEIRNLCFDYPGVPVLDNVSLSLEAGEIAAIIGENGAGKSTLIKCVSALLKPGSGTVMLDGSDVQRMKRKEMARRLAYLSQYSTQLFPVTVFEMVLLGRYPYGTGRSREDENKVVEILRMLGLQSVALRDFNEISGGQRQQVLIARALAQEVEVMVLDEPTNNLDIRHQIEVMDVLRTLVKTENKLVLLTIHDLNLAARYADKIIVLHDGTVTAVGTPEQVITKDTVETVYGIKVEIGTCNGKPYFIPLESRDNSV